VKSRSAFVPRALGKIYFHGGINTKYIIQWDWAKFSSLMGLRQIQLRYTGHIHS
jgi:hypothetical protein